MKEGPAFSGFPERARVTPIPNLFFSVLLPQIKDLAELKVVLHIMWRLSQKRGYCRFVTRGELEGDVTLLGGLGEAADLGSSLAQAIHRGVLIPVTVEGQEGKDELFFLNTEADRRAAEKVKRGVIRLEGLLPRPQAALAEERPTIFSLYEENIGTLTPLVAEELTEAEKLYPWPWIEEAFREAAALNKRSWRYIQRILERWASEGRGDGEAGRGSEPHKDKYSGGRYRHLIRG